MVTFTEVKINLKMANSATILDTNIEFNGIGKLVNSCEVDFDSYSIISLFNVILIFFPCGWMPSIHREMEILKLSVIFFFKIFSIILLLFVTV